MNVAACGEIHHRIGAPADGPHHLLDFVGDGRRDGRIADIGVDLHQEVAADDHRLEFRVIDIGRNDGASASDLVAHEFARHEFRNGGAEALTVRNALGGVVERPFTTKILPMRDKDHFFRDDPCTREFELRDGRVSRSAIKLALRRTRRSKMFAGCASIVLGLGRAAFERFKAG